MPLNFRGSLVEYFRQEILDSMVEGGKQAQEAFIQALNGGAPPGGEPGKDEDEPRFDGRQVNNRSIVGDNGPPALGHTAPRGPGRPPGSKNNNGHNGNGKQR